MYINTYDFEVFGKQYRESLARDMRDARQSQSRFFQQLGQLLVKSGSRLERMGQPIQMREKMIQLQPKGSV